MTTILITGGATAFKRCEGYKRACRHINFSHEDGEVIDAGINARMSEFCAAIGSSVLNEIWMAFQKRGGVHRRYYEVLEGRFEMSVCLEGVTRSCVYLPIFFPSEEAMSAAQQRLNEVRIFSRWHFYPSPDALGYGQPGKDEPHIVGPGGDGALLSYIPGASTRDFEGDHLNHGLVGRTAGWEDPGAWQSVQ